MLGGGAEKIAKPPQCIGPYSLLLKGSYPKVIETLLGKDVEMVEPKIHHHFLELPGTFHGSQETRLGGLFHDHARPLPGTLSGLLVTFLSGDRGWTIFNEELGRAKG